MWSLAWLALGVLLVTYFIKGRRTKQSPHKNFPGPKAKFIVGNAFDFFMKPESLFFYFRHLSNKYKDMYELKLGTKRFILMYHPEDIEALITSTKYNDKGYLYTFLRPWLRDGLLLSNGKKWHHRRKILTPTFHFKILRNFNSVLIDKSAQLVERLQSELNQSKTNCYPILADFTLNSICETAMGTALDEESLNISKYYKDAIPKLGSYLLYRISRIWLHLDVTFNLCNIGRKQKQILEQIASFRDCVIKKRRQNGNFDNNLYTQLLDEQENDDLVVNDKKRSSLLDVLLAAEQQGQIDNAGINEEVDTFMFEGHDTTATALHFAFMLLANNPDVQDKIVKEYLDIFGSPDQRPTLNDLTEMKYLEACIKESLRLYPPVYFIERTSEHPLKMRHFETEPGLSYVILLYDLHRRSDQFIEPLEFRPERFLKEPTWHPFAYLPFSGGQRNCIGQKFAMMEMKLAISAVLLKYRLLPVTKPRDVIFTVDLILRPSIPVYVQFVER